MKTKIDIYKLVNYVEKLNYIYWFFMGSALFLISSLPFWIVLFVFDFRIANLPVFYIASLPLGPSLYALLNVMGAIETNGKIIRPFIDAYRHFFKKALFVWSIAMLIVLIASANTVLSTQLFSTSFFKWVNVLVILGVVSFVVNYYLLNASFDNVPLKNGLLTTVKLSIIKSGRYATSIILILGSFIILNEFSIYLVLFGSGIIGFLLTVNFRPIAEFVANNQNN